MQRNIKIGVMVTLILTLIAWGLAVLLGISMGVVERVEGLSDGSTRSNPLHLGQMSATGRMMMFTAGMVGSLVAAALGVFVAWLARKGPDRIVGQTVSESNTNQLPSGGPVVHFEPSPAEVFENDQGEHHTA